VSSVFLVLWLKVTELPFFASKVRLGRCGIEEILPLGPLNEFERFVFHTRTYNYLGSCYVLNLHALHDSTPVLHMLSTEYLSKFSLFYFLSRTTGSSCPLMSPDMIWICQVVVDTDDKSFLCLVFSCAWTCWSQVFRRPEYSSQEKA
jgi:hypothetical protein